MKLLTNQGFDSSRNLAKPMRAQRVRLVNGQFVINDLDNLPLRVDGEKTNTTGCFGTRSTFGLHMSVVIKRGAPGKVKYGGNSRGRGVRRLSTMRNPGLGIHDHCVAEFQTSLKRQVLNVRNRVETFCLMLESRLMDIPGNILAARTFLNSKMKELLLPQELSKAKAGDANRVKTIIGMARHGDIRTTSLKAASLIQDIDRVLHALRNR